MQSPYIPIQFVQPTRRDRDIERGRAAGARVKAAGGTAREAALAWIETAFDGSLTHSLFKDRVQRFLDRGAADPEVRARFGRLARAFPIARPEDADLGWCISVLDRAWAQNREIIHRAPLYFAGRSLNKQPDALRDARLIVRWLRRTHRSHLWPMILATVSEQIEHRPVRTVFITRLQAAE